MKFLIDECLSPDLVQLAIDAGYAESSHVVWRKMLRWSDHRLMKAIIEGDWTLVTRNSDDFRPPRGSASLSPRYVGHDLHAGLVCLNLPTGTRKDHQIKYFQKVLHELGNQDDLTNEIVEIWPDNEVAGETRVERYDFPT